MKDLQDLSGYVPVQYIIYTILVLIVLAGIFVKSYPKIRGWFETARLNVNAKENLVKTVEKNSEDINQIRSDISEINQKIGKDYARLNQMQKITEKQQKYIEDSLEERELIIRSLLGVVQGLQEVGANGPTKKAESEIQAYLLRKSHETQSDMEI